MKEYRLNPQESLTVMDMVQDAIDRGMISSHYETGQLENIIKQSTDEFEEYKKGVEFEIIIRVKNETQ